MSPILRLVSLFDLCEIGTATAVLDVNIIQEYLFFLSRVKPTHCFTISMAENPSQDVGNRSTLRASEILWKVVVTRCENL